MRMSRKRLNVQSTTKLRWKVLRKRYEHVTNFVKKDSRFRSPSSANCYEELILSSILMEIPSVRRIGYTVLGLGVTLTRYKGIGRGIGWLESLLKPSLCFLSLCL